MVYCDVGKKAIKCLIGPLLTPRVKKPLLHSLIFYVVTVITVGKKPNVSNLSHIIIFIAS